MTNAKPAKLRNGSWGAKVSGAVRQGDEITITTAAGKSWTATVARVLWSGSGATLVATESRPANPWTDGSSSPRASGRARGRGSAPRVPGYSSYCTDSPSCGCYDCAS